MSINQAAASGSSAREIKADDHPDNNIFSIGEKVLVRTVTFAYIGRIIGFEYCLGVPFMILEQAGFLAVTDRFSVGLEKGTVGEFEPIVGLYRANVASIVDVCQWTHPLITKAV